VESTVLVKSFALLEALANCQRPASLSELASLTGNTKPTAHRVLQSLTALGYVAAVGGGAYQLTGKLRQLSLGPTDRWLAAHAEQALRKLHTETGETVNLGVLRHNRMVYVAVLESQHALRRVARVHDDDPVLCTALGRAIASYLPEAQLNLLLRSQSPERRTSKTVTDPKKLREILLRAKRDGYAIERDQTDIGVTCLGVPVVVAGQAIAAISISAPSARVNPQSERRWLDLLRKAARKLERDLKEEQQAIA
jgi:DNA-binding IclR family transcriptional regulator